MKLNLYQRSLKGMLRPPSDKSISHRALIFGAMSTGTTTIHQLLKSQDCLATLKALQQMGVSMIEDGDTITIHGKPIEQWKSNNQLLNLQNSGTSMRLFLGLLAQNGHHVTLIGDASLSNRPMDRVIIPLTQMGAHIESYHGKAPLVIEPATLSSITYSLPIASAQLKSAIILAALQASGTTTIIEPLKTRNHTEKMLPLFGGNIECQDNKIIVRGKQKLKGTTVTVPGDISSAAFFIAGALLSKESYLTLKNVGINESRDGFLRIIKQMGAHLTFKNKQLSNEPTADIEVIFSSLKSISIDESLIPLCIDELPLIALIATQAQGKTVIRGAQELKVKESNRLAAVFEILTQLGAKMTLLEDGWEIYGPTPLYGATVDTLGDHRLAMMASIASLIAKGTMHIKNSHCIDISYPQFYEDLFSIIH